MSISLCSPNSKELRRFNRMYKEHRVKEEEKKFNSSYTPDVPSILKYTFQSLIKHSFQSQHSRKEKKNKNNRIIQIGQRNDRKIKFHKIKMATVFYLKAYRKQKQHSCESAITATVSIKTIH